MHSNSPKLGAAYDCESDLRTTHALTQDSDQGNGGVAKAHFLPSIAVSGSEVYRQKQAKNKYSALNKCAAKSKGKDEREHGTWMGRRSSRCSNLSSDKENELMTVL